MAEQDRGNEQYITEQFKRYYATEAQRVEAPPEIRRREFGFLSFGGRTMFRHIGFQDPQQFRGYLREYAPAHTYFSAAYYKDPRASMAEKGWLGADLVFDIDSDHFDLPCQKEHDRWTCRTCGKEGKGHPPETCHDCKKATFIEETWLCENCLRAAKYEAQKLLDILIEDFGFQASGELSVNFSGNRGFHVHVRSPSAKELDQLARREIVDYIRGIGIEAEYQGLIARRGRGGTASEQRGWRGRSIRALYDFIAEATPEQIKGLKLGRGASLNLIESRDEILTALMNKQPSRVVKYIDGKSMGKLLEAAVREQASAIDTVVTTDLRRLIRLPNTLHGKTGWLTQNIPIDDLADYDPLTQAIAFTEGTERVFINRAPEIVLSGETYGPFEEESLELPLAVAIFLLCKNAARVER
ncbi:MAG: DNA primase small subunit PriS [Candidatus Bathyarchaeota archaeon]|nr:MAG: DNA primase small subunit PriS [Candidatus Bathyarchaeota archaeon]